MTMRGLQESGRRDSNSRLLGPKPSALAKLRHAPKVDVNHYTVRDRPTHSNASASQDLQQSLEVIVVLEAEHELAAILAGELDLDAQAQLLAQLVLDADDVVGLGDRVLDWSLAGGLLAIRAVGITGRFCWVQCLLDEDVGGVNRQVAENDLLAELRLQRLVRDSLQDLGVAGAQGATTDGGLHVVGKVEESEQVGDHGARDAKPAAKFLVGHLEAAEVVAKALGLLDRVEIGPLDVLDQGGFHHLLIVEVDDLHGHLREAERTDRSQAALAGDELVALADAADDQRLEHAMVANRVAQRLQVRLVESSPRLVRVDVDGGDGQLLSEVLLDDDFLHEMAPSFRELVVGRRAFYLAAASEGNAGFGGDRRPSVGKTAGSGDPRRARW